MTSVLLVHGWEIVEAVAETCSDGFVKDIFVIKSLLGETINDELLAHMSRDLSRLFAEELSVDDYLVSSQVVKTSSEGRKKVDVYNPVTIDYTLVDIKVSDRPGLLYDISHCLSRSGMDIISFTANSYDDFVRDSFLILDDKGRKVEDPEKIEKLKELILSVL